MSAQPLRERVNKFGNIESHYLHVIDCYTCGEVFAVTQTYSDVRQRDCHTFYCPNGHTCAYSRGKTREQQLQEQLVAQKAEVERQRQLRIDAEKRTSAQIGINTKLKKRIHAGICPHCQRTFKQLAAHMQSKHSELGKSVAAVDPHVGISTK